MERRFYRSHSRTGRAAVDPDAARARAAAALPMSLDEIASVLGCSHETVRLTELRALRKVRAELERINSKGGA